MLIRGLFAPTRSDAFSSPSALTGASRSVRASLVREGKTDGFEPCDDRAKATASAGSASGLGPRGGRQDASTTTAGGEDRVRRPTSPLRRATRFWYQDHPGEVRGRSADVGGSVTVADVRVGSALGQLTDFTAMTVIRRLRKIGTQDGRKNCGSWGRLGT
jgi:hypothetical protein